MSTPPVKIAAIVPAFNEEETIGGVVRALASSGLFSEVVVISDGSTDRTAKEAKAAGATMVHELPRRGGKGKAMQHGITHTDSSIVFFCDADLFGLTTPHLEAILAPVMRGERVMNIGIRDRGALMMKISPHLPLIGGERALYRHIIEAIPDKYLRGFMVESALNYYCRINKLPYGTSPMPGLKIRHKYQKVGCLRGIWQYFKMSWQSTKAILTVRLAHLTGRFHV